MGRELGKIQQKSSTRRIIVSNQSNSDDSSSSVGSNSSVKMRPKLLDERATAILYTVVAALTYVVAGTMVGWSSGTFRRAEQARTGHPGPSLPHLDNWSISLAATPAIVITVTAFVVHRCYYWIGTKAFLLTAALLAIGSSALDALGPSFVYASAARILAGISAGMAFTLVPQYVDEFGPAGPQRAPLDEILAAAFPFGVLLRFVADLLLPPTLDPMLNAVLWAILPTCAFLGLLFLPESPRYLCATGRVPQAAAILQKTHEPSVQPHTIPAALDHWQRPGPGLLEAIRGQTNLTVLLPLLSLFAFQAFVGALPMLFYLTDLLELAGQRRAPERAAALLAAIFTLTVPLARTLHRREGLHRPLLVIGTLFITVAMLGLGWHCHARRTGAPELVDVPSEWPLYAFGALYAAYAVGLHRIPGALLESETATENLFAVRTLATAVCWGSVYVGVRILPPLLRTIGLGWVLWNAAIVALFAAGVVLLCLPRPDGYGRHKALTVGSRPASSSSESSDSCSPSPPPAYWPCVHMPDGEKGPPRETVVTMFSTLPDNGPELV